MVCYEEDWHGAPVDPIALVTRLAQAEPHPESAGRAPFVVARDVRTA